MCQGVLEVEDGGSGDGNSWVQIQVGGCWWHALVWCRRSWCVGDGFVALSVVLQIWFLRLLVFCGGEELRW